MEAGIGTQTSQLQQQFTGEEHHTRGLLCLVPSIMVGSEEEHPVVIEDLLYWERDLPFPKSLGGEVRRWQVLWQHKHDELPDDSTIPRNLLVRGARDNDSFPQHPLPPHHQQHSPHN